MLKGLPPLGPREITIISHQKHKSNPEIQKGPGKSDRVKAVFLESQQLESFQVVAIGGIIGPKSDHTAPRSDIQKWLTTSHVVVVLTDSARQLNTLLDKLVLNDMKGKMNVIVAHSVHDHDSISFQQSTISKTREHLSSIIQVDAIQPLVLPVRAVSGAIVNADELLQTIDSSFKNIEQLEQDRYAHAVSFALGKTAEAIELELQESKSQRDAINEMADNLKFTHQEMIDSFTIKDIGVLHEAVIKLSLALNTYFKRTQFWKLAFKCDHISADIQKILLENSLEKAEFQMAFVTGKLDHAMHSMFKDIQINFTKLASKSKEVDSRAELPQISSYINEQYVTSTSQINPFLLSNMISLEKDIYECAVLQVKAQRAILQQFVYQVAQYLT